MSFQAYDPLTGLTPISGNRLSAAIVEHYEVNVTSSDYLQWGWLVIKDKYGNQITPADATPLYGTAVVNNKSYNVVFTLIDGYWRGRVKTLDNWADTTTAYGIFKFGIIRSAQGSNAIPVDPSSTDNINIWIETE